MRKPKASAPPVCSQTRVMARQRLFCDDLTALGLEHGVGVQGRFSIWSASGQHLVSIWPPGQAPMPARAWSGRGRPTKTLRRRTDHKPVSIRNSHRTSGCRTPRGEDGAASTTRPPCASPPPGSSSWNRRRFPLAPQSNLKRQQTFISEGRRPRGSANLDGPPRGGINSDHTTTMKHCAGAVAGKMSVPAQHTEHQKPRVVYCIEVLDGAAFVPGVRCRQAASGW
jgi:hypothetical protein